ncbi:hypothetical protein [Flavihumibacter sp. UBA7668]|uniref:hypothetical protein n=1 Tax=Flavihumibacter sp. UBA7668 TaxID=1946542 RepID=UPI0025C323DC|nr:hypothetical protein [Flavihumibacter sp. UBA7668]
MVEWIFFGLNVLNPALRIPAKGDIVAVQEWVKDLNDQPKNAQKRIMRGNDIFSPAA